jgi:acyl-CoA thioesterase
MKAAGLRRLSASQAAWVRQLAAKMPFYRFMGIRLTKLWWGRSEIRIRVNRELTQQAGFAHGGVSASLIDSAVGLALCTMIERGRAISTINLQVNFLAPAKPGLLTARGRIVHKGKRTAVGDCHVADEDGKLVSKGTATYMILENRKLDPISSP